MEYYRHSNEFEFDKQHVLLFYEMNNTNKHFQKEVSKEIKLNKTKKILFKSHSHTIIIGIAIAHIKRSHTGITVVTGGGWYKFKSAHKKPRRTGFTKYFNINHVTSTRKSENPSKINFNNEIGCNVGWRLEYKRNMNYGYRCF